MWPKYDSFCFLIRLSLEKNKGREGIKIENISKEFNKKAVITGSRYEEVIHKRGKM